LLGNTQILERLWNWAKEQRATEELNNKLLSAIDSDRQTAWYVTAEKAN
jgi:hypothetical protein